MRQYASRVRASLIDFFGGLHREPLRPQYLPREKNTARRAVSIFTEALAGIEKATIDEELGDYRESLDKRMQRSLSRNP